MCFHPALVAADTPAGAEGGSTLLKVRACYLSKEHEASFQGIVAAAVMAATVVILTSPHQIEFGW